MTKRKITPWTDFADEVIATNYPTGGVAACVPLLPGRSKGSIFQRARILGIKREGFAARAYPTARVAAETLTPYELAQAKLADLHRDFMAVDRLVPVFNAGPLLAVIA